MTTLFTIGYERFGPETWLRLLESKGVEVVVDVRDLPLSRRPGFSKTALAQRLAHAGVDYVHVRQLGNPKPLRDRLKRGMDFDTFAGTFRSLLGQQTDALCRVFDLMAAKNVCLLCYEEDPAACHRSLVAEHLAAGYQGPVRVVHFRRDDLLS